MAFFNTGWGKRLLEHDVPALIRQLTRLNDLLERHLDKKEEEADDVSLFVGHDKEDILFVTTCPVQAHELRSEHGECFVAGPLVVE